MRKPKSDSWKKKVVACIAWEELNDLLLKKIKDPDKAEKITDKIWVAMVHIIDEAVHE